MSKYPILTEGPHPAEFILTEATGSRSRDQAYLADPSTVRVGQPLTKSAEATTDLPATYTVATVGANVHALAIYGGTSTSGEGLRIAVLTRDAEVNGKLLYWGAMTGAEEAAGKAKLATLGIIIRDTGK